MITQVRPLNPVGILLGVAVAAIAGPAGASALVAVAFAGVQGLGFGPAESETYAWQLPAFLVVLAAMAMAPTVVFVGLGRTTWPRAFGIHDAGLPRRPRFSSREGGSAKGPWELEPN